MNRRMLMLKVRLICLLLLVGARCMSAAAWGAKKVANVPCGTRSGRTRAYVGSSIPGTDVRCGRPYSMRATMAGKTAGDPRGRRAVQQADTRRDDRRRGGGARGRAQLLSVHGFLERSAVFQDHGSVSLASAGNGQGGHRHAEGADRPLPSPQDAVHCRHPHERPARRCARTAS